MVNKKKKKHKKWPGSVLDAPFASDYDILRATWIEAELPMWVVKKVCKAFFKVMRAKLLAGFFVHILNFGSFVPYRKRIRVYGAYDETKTRITYKWKIATLLNKELLERTKKEVLSVQGSEDTSGS